MTAAEGGPEIRTKPSWCCICGGQPRTVIGSGIDFEYDSCSNSFDYVRCQACGHHYLSPFPDPAELPVIYPPHYANYSSSAKPGLAFRVKGWMEGRMLSALLLGGSDGELRVLDVGCGDGRLLDGIRRYCTNVGQLHGVEISADAARLARAKGYVVWIGNFEDLTIPEGRYDLIFLIQVLEHLFDPIGCVQSLHRLLKPGGRLVFETPSTGCVDFELFKRRYWGGYHFPRHLNLFDPHSLPALLEQKGFEIVSVRHKLQPVHWIWSFHHVFKERQWPEWWVRQFHIKNPIFLAIFSVVDLMQLLMLRRTSNMQVIARRRID